MGDIQRQSENTKISYLGSPDARLSEQRISRVPATSLQEPGVAEV